MEPRLKTKPARVFGRLSFTSNRGTLTRSPLRPVILEDACSDEHCPQTKASGVDTMRPLVASFTNLDIAATDNII